MPSDKRTRQKELRQERIAAVRAAERRSAVRQRGLLVGGLVGAFLVAAIVIGIFAAADDDDEQDLIAADDTSVLDDGPEEPLEDPVDTGPEAIAGTPPTTVPAGEPVAPECPPAEGSAEPQYDFTGPFEGCLEEGVDYRARFETTVGDVVVDLREDQMPSTVGNFVALARYGYYDGTDLFRTNTGIDIIQGGSPHTQDNADPGPGYTIPDEGGEFTLDEATGQYTGPFDYQAGQLIMARSAGPDSSGAQFFFSTGPDVSNLDSQGTYLLFGDVVEGMDVLEQVMDLHIDTGAGGPGEGRPSEYVIVQDVEITTA